MRRLPVLLAAVLGGAIVAVGVAMILDARGDDGGSSISRPRASMTVVSATVRPSTPHFGETVVAEIVLVGDKIAIDPRSVRVNPDFSPYEPIAPRQVRRTETATSVRWHFRFAVRCLREGCAPEGARRAMDFPGAAVVYRFRSAQGPSTAIVDWPDFEVSARVPDSSLLPEKWRADVTSLPAVTYDRSTSTVAAALVGGSVLFALLGVGLVWWVTRSRELEVVDTGEAEVVALSPLERALQLAREAALDGDSPERRKAFERAARELTAVGHPELADRARALAWSSGPANVGEVDELVRDTYAALNGRLT